MIVFENLCIFLHMWKFLYAFWTFFWLLGLLLFQTIYYAFINECVSILYTTQRMFSFFCKRDHIMRTVLRTSFFPPWLCLRRSSHVSKGIAPSFNIFKGYEIFHRMGEPLSVISMFPKFCYCSSAIVTTFHIFLCISVISVEWNSGGEISH